MAVKTERLLSAIFTTEVFLRDFPSPEILRNAMTFRSLYIGSNVIIRRTYVSVVTDWVDVDDDEATPGDWFCSTFHTTTNTKIKQSNVSRSKVPGVE